MIINIDVGLESIFYSDLLVIEVGGVESLNRNENVEEIGCIGTMF